MLVMTIQTMVGVAGDVMQVMLAGHLCSATVEPMVRRW